jgi:hypothetical protein
MKNRACLTQQAGKDVNILISFISIFLWLHLQAARITGRNRPATLNRTMAASPLDEPRSVALIF